VEQISNTVRVSYSDGELNALLESIGDGERSFSRHFDQGEDFFLKLEDAITVPHFRIHHDVRQPQPNPAYLSALRGVMEQVARLAPQVLKGLTYFFDPAEIQRPCFYHVHRFEESLYVYLLRIDLMMRGAESTVIERGSPDETPVWSSRKLFMKTTVIPLEEVVRQDGTVKAFRIRQMISPTWIGEYGRRYAQKGIWMDADLTRFFSRLFLPADRKTYPYFPYLCEYNTVCYSVIDLSPEGRMAAIPFLHRSVRFLLPVMERIQREMRNEKFSEEIGIFRELKSKVPEAWYEQWKKIRVQASLNESDMKEYRIDD
jgi:hypothetical protein